MYESDFCQKEANDTMVLQKLGEVAAYYLDNLLNDNMILGISWGNTMYHTVKAGQDK